MAQHAANTATGQSSLRLIKGKEEYQKELTQLSCTAWQIAYTALWNTVDFSAQEKQLALKFITQFIDQSTGHKKAYNEFIQRVLLARQYIITHPGTFIPVPSKWLDEENKKGFAGTARWYNSLQITRASMPQYKIPLKAFGEAVLETIQTSAAKDFHYWRSYFIQNNCQSLLNLFLSTIANCLNSLDTPVKSAMLTPVTVIE
jgi:hypothetical protein